MRRVVRATALGGAVVFAAVQAVPYGWQLEERDELNFSEWDGDADDAAESIADGSMPPTRYTLVHPSARLSAADKRHLIDALVAMDEAEDD